MKQYTRKEQTTKLIELGFPRPTSIINEHKVLESNPYAPIEFEHSYSIGELIGFICNPVIECLAEVWRVEYDGSKGKLFIEEDLIDALYKACIYSKENPQYD